MRWSWKTGNGKNNEQDPAGDGPAGEELISSCSKEQRARRTYKSKSTWGLQYCVLSAAKAAKRTLSQHRKTQFHSALASLLCCWTSIYNPNPLSTTFGHKVQKINSKAINRRSSSTVYSSTKCVQIPFSSFYVMPKATQVNKCGMLEAGYCTSSTTAYVI